jgi:hypothetical protein
MKNLSILFIFILFSSLTNAQVSIFFKQTDAFLKIHVSNKKVDYDAIKKDPTTLNGLIKTIAEMNLAKESDQNKKAFYINAYNLVLINAIVSKYPVKSPMDVAGIFDKTKYEVAGNKMTLNDIENKMIREKYNDPRIHFVLVCGANGCPPITNFAYLPEKLDEQLDKQTKLAINNPNFIKINHSSKKVEVSQIFEWYKGDFVSKKSNLIDFLNKYLEKPIEEGYKVGYYTYDWSLNKK